MSTAPGHHDSCGPGHHCLGLNGPMGLPPANNSFFERATNKFLRKLNLGKDVAKCATLKEAAEGLMRRDYRDVGTEGDQARVHFVPDCFITEKKSAQKVPMESDLVSERTERQCQETFLDGKPIQAFDAHIKGAYSEYSVFQALKDLFKSTQDKNAFVFHGLATQWHKKLEGSTKIAANEFDFLIISQDHRLVVNIECKSSSQIRPLKSAERQLEDCHQLIRQNMNIGPGWSFVKALAVPCSESLEVCCEECRKWVVFPERECLARWWQEITRRSEERSPDSEIGEDGSTYKDLIKTLLFLGKMKDTNCLSLSEETKMEYKIITELRGTAENIIFWTNDQFNILNDCKKVAFFDCSYGTGKTILLKAKAKELINKGQKVTFILFPFLEESCYSRSQEAIRLKTFSDPPLRKKDPGVSKSLLFKSLEKELGSSLWSDYDRLFCSNRPSGYVYGMTKKCGECRHIFHRVIKEALEQGHVFIDELPYQLMRECEIVADELMSACPDLDHYLWVVKQVDSKPMFGPTRQGFASPNLKLPLRNSAEVAVAVRNGFDVLSRSSHSERIRVYNKADMSNAMLTAIEGMRLKTDGDITVILDFDFTTRATLDSLLNLDFEQSKRLLIDEVFIYPREQLTEKSLAGVNPNIDGFLEPKQPGSRRRILFTNQQAILGWEAESVVVVHASKSNQLNLKVTKSRALVNLTEVILANYLVLSSLSDELNSPTIRLLQTDCPEKLDTGLETLKNCVQEWQESCEKTQILTMNQRIMLQWQLQDRQTSLSILDVRRDLWKFQISVDTRLKELGQDAESKGELTDWEQQLGCLNAKYQDWKKSFEADTDELEPMWEDLFYTMPRYEMLSEQLGLLLRQLKLRRDMNLLYRCLQTESPTVSDSDSAHGLEIESQLVSEESYDYLPEALCNDEHNTQYHSESASLTLSDYSSLEESKYDSLEQTPSQNDFLDKSLSEFMSTPPSESVSKSEFESELKIPSPCKYDTLGILECQFESLDRSQSQHKPWNVSQNGCKSMAYSQSLFQSEKGSEKGTELVNKLAQWKTLGAKVEDCHIDWIEWRERLRATLNFWKGRHYINFNPEIYDKLNKQLRDGQKSLHWEYDALSSKFCF